MYIYNITMGHTLHKVISIFKFTDYLTITAILMLMFSLNISVNRFRINVSKVNLSRGFIFFMAIGLLSLGYDIYYTIKPQTNTYIAIQSLCAIAMFFMVSIWITIGWVYPIRYSSKLCNKKEYIKKFISIIRTGNKKELGILVEELSKSIPCFFKEKDANIRTQVLKMLNNMRLIKSMAFTSPETIYNIFDYIDKNDIDEHDVEIIRNFCITLTSYLIKHKTSILYDDMDNILIPKKTFSDKLFCNERVAKIMANAQQTYPVFDLSSYKNIYDIDQIKMLFCIHEKIYTHLLGTNVNIALLNISQSSIYLSSFCNLYQNSKTEQEMSYNKSILDIVTLYFTNVINRISNNIENNNIDKNTMDELEKNLAKSIAYIIISLSSVDNNPILNHDDNIVQCICARLLIINNHSKKFIHKINTFILNAIIRYMKKPEALIAFGNKPDQQYVKVLMSSIWDYYSSKDMIKFMDQKFIGRLYDLKEWHPSKNNTNYE